MVKIHAFFKSKRRTLWNGLRAAKRGLAKVGVQRLPRFLVRILKRCCLHKCLIHFLQSIWQTYSQANMEKWDCKLTIYSFQMRKDFTEEQAHFVAIVWPLPTGLRWLLPFLSPSYWGLTAIRTFQKRTKLSDIFNICSFVSSLAPCHSTCLPKPDSSLIPGPKLKGHGQHILVRCHSGEMRQGQAAARASPTSRLH